MLEHSLEDRETLSAAAMMADSAANPPPEQPRYECDCEIPVGASRAPPRLPWRNAHVIVHPLCSLRVAVVGAFIIIVVLIFPVVLFLFVLVWLLSKDDVGSNRSIRRG